MSPVNSSESTSRSKGWDNAKDGYRVVLFDLDSTLVNSELARQKAWEQALSQLDGPLGHFSIDGRIAAYRAIYDCHDIITGQIGSRGYVFADVRQEWNTRESYAILIAWCKGRFPPEDPQSYARELRDTLADHRDEILDEAELIANGTKIELAGPIDRAVNAFWQGDWRSNFLFPGVRELLDELQRSGVEYCVATEGHLLTQWKKICAAGLDEVNHKTGLPWVSPGQLLATSQAARPEEELRALNQIIEWYRGHAAAGRAAAKVLGPADARTHGLDRSAQAASKIAKGLEAMTRLFEKLSRKLYEHGDDERKQVQPEFYNRVLYAVSQSGRTPRDWLTRPDLEWNTSRRLRVAVVGDHYSNDVKPVVELSKRLGKRIMPIWIRGQSRHGKKPVRGRHSNWKDRWCEAKTIEDAGKHLLDTDFWRTRTDRLQSPVPLFEAAIMPERASNSRGLQENISSFLTCIAAIRSGLGHSSDDAPGEDIVKRAEKFVDALEQHVKVDVANSPQLEEVLKRAYVVCSEMSSSPIGIEFPGLPLAGIGFILSLAEIASAGRSRPDYLTPYLKQVAEGFLSLPDGGAWHNSDWAAAVAYSR